MSKTTIGNGHHKDFVQDTTNEWGKKLAEEAQARADAKEAYKDEYKTHSMEISRDDIDRFKLLVGRGANVGKWKEFLSFMTGDKGYWTEELTLKIVDHDSEYTDYDDSKTQQ